MASGGTAILMRCLSAAPRKLPLDGDVTHRVSRRRLKRATAVPCRVVIRAVSGRGGRRALPINGPLCRFRSNSNG